MVCVTGHQANDLPVPSPDSKLLNHYGAHEKATAKPVAHTTNIRSPTIHFQAQRVEAKKNPKDRYKQHSHSLAGNNQTSCGRMGLNRQPCRTCLGSAAFVEHCNGNGWVKNEPKSSESSVGDRPQVVFFQASVHLRGWPFLSVSLSLSLLFQGLCHANPGLSWPCLWNYQIIWLAILRPE